MFNIESYLANIYLLTPGIHFLLENIHLKFRQLFLRGILLSSNLSCSTFFRGTLLPKCAYRPWDHFCFLVKRCKYILNHYSNHVSLIPFSSLSLYLSTTYRRSHFISTPSPPPGPTSCDPTSLYLSFPAGRSQPHPVEVPHAHESVTQRDKGISFS